MLVRTGVYDPEGKESIELRKQYAPKYEVGDVMEAVELAVRMHMTRE
jgi:hypothetical protein